MINSFLEILFSLSLFIFGGNILDTKFSLHHYDDDDYKEIFFLKNKESVIKKCTKHLELESIEKIVRPKPQGDQEAVYKITKTEEDS
jgi:hypothetical protein|tara:strand:+ start:471 stop:731 length:261 start_codon:yes stop_codon:yes gene_type:complete